MKFPTILLGVVVSILLLGTASFTNASIQADTIEYQIVVNATELDPDLVIGDPCIIVNSLGEPAELILIGTDITNIDAYASKTLDDGVVVALRDSLACSETVSGTIGIDVSYRASIAELKIPSIGNDFSRTISAQTLSNEGSAINIEAFAYRASEYVDQPFPYLPTASNALEISAAPVATIDGSLDPSFIDFSVFGFNDNETAVQEFAHLADWAVSDASGGLVIADSGYEEVSIGKLGDDRRAFLKAGYEAPQQLIALILKGNSILVITSSGSSGDVTKYVANFLAVFLTDKDGNATNLLPKIDDLPVGWELQPDGGPRDILTIVTYVYPTSTPVAFPPAA